MLQSTKHKAQSTNNKAYNNNKINNNLKQAFTLLELSIVITVISVLLTTMLVSKVLIRSAKINKVYQDYRDINALMNIFQNTFGCLPGDCNITELPMTVINGTPSGCFNLSTTTGMGNENTTGNSVGTTSALSPPIIAAFGTGTISTNANRTCAFYEMQAFEPTAFGGRAAKNSLFEFNKAWAIGTGGVLNILNNPIITATLSSQAISLQSQISTNNTTISTNNATINNCAQYINAASTANPVHAYNSYGNPGSSFFASNSVQGPSLGWFTTYYTFNVTSLSSSYTLLSSMTKNDSNFNVVGGTGVYINGGYISGSNADWVQAASITIPASSLQLGINTIQVSAYNTLAFPSAAAQLINASGNSIFNAVDYSNSGSYASSANSGNGIATGCPGGGGSFCASSCAAGLGGTSGGMAGAYNNFIINNNQLQANNNNLQSQLTAFFNPNNYISLSIPTATNPLMPSFQNQAMWELSTVGSNGSAGFYPYELNDTTNMGYMKNQTLLIARSSSTNNITDTTNDMSAFDSNFAFKIDQKYDDGMPYTGSIIAGQNISQMSPGGTGCTTATTISVATPTASPTANYITSNSSNLTFGCVVGFGLRLT